MSKTVPHRAAQRPGAAHQHEAQHGADPCSDPAHHVHDAAAYVRAVEQACATRGIRLTPLRAQVLGLVAAAGKPIKAYDLLDRLKQGSASAAPPSVYRALDFLLEQGFIHRLESINAFIGCHHPQVRHSVPFLICDGCQDAIELEDERIGEMLDAQARALGFQPRAQTIEVHGLCAGCAARQAPA
jgi:Fur family zinc uptake transcriptional regulator